MVKNKLKPCPCGKTPKELSITDSGQGGKWANVSGDCCGEWMIEFRTLYHALESDECIKLAIEAWNKAPRANAILEKQIADLKYENSGLAACCDSLSADIYSYKDQDKEK